MTKENEIIKAFNLLTSLGVVSVNKIGDNSYKVIKQLSINEKFGVIAEYMDGEIGEINKNKQI